MVNIFDLLGFREEVRVGDDVMLHHRFLLHLLVVHPLPTITKLSRITSEVSEISYLAKYPTNPNRGVVARTGIMLVLSGSRPLEFLAKFINNGMDANAMGAQILPRNPSKSWP